MQFHVENMTCGSCVKHITQAIATVDPDARLEADTVSRTISVTTVADADAIQKALADDGYTARPI
ncbi:MULTISPECIES: heavy-metal-associated domain-containing protein [Brevundimonas]|jgi:copper chaperone|uniref:heavy-metal-associated domain-containing protein n=1 Tax=Brevundimonas TaxID=41275 RepID=UPI000377FC01|nr:MULTISPECIES: heavy-metal-associated domain-containing protein [Brevundimonas]MCC4293425.1 heavy-metal-associated domain-containing protein [Brevundimonas aurantiaca]